jgi:hypothetical protein
VSLKRRNFQRASKHTRMESIGDIVFCFAVNGGAFAVAKLFADPKTSNVLGSLTLRQLSIGMILFTIVMVLDIYMFGEKMRSQYLPEGFGWQGKIVLLLLGILICAGWFLVA